MPMSSAFPRQCAVLGAGEGAASIWGEEGKAEKVLGEHLAVVLNAVTGAGGPERSAYDHVHWSAYVFGSGTSRVALIVPRLPHPNDRKAPTHDQYAVVSYLVREDERDTGEAARRENWGYRMAPIEKLAA